MSDKNSCKEVTIKVYPCPKCEEKKPEKPESEPRSYYGWILAVIAATIAYYAQGCSI